MGLYKVQRLPFGISSAPAIFQRTMDSFLKHIPNTIVYLNDILITGKTQEEHDTILEKALTTLQDAGLSLSKEKCKFNQDGVSFLGHYINKHGITPLAARVEAITKMRQPTRITELRTFLGMMNYYHKFVPNMATKLEPLYKLLRKENYWKWEKEQDEAFHKAKNILKSSPILTHYQADLPLVLATDASAYGVGAVLL